MADPEARVVEVNDPDAKPMIAPGDAVVSVDGTLELVALERAAVSGPATREIAAESASEIAAA